MNKANPIVEIIRSPAFTAVTITVCILVGSHYLIKQAKANGLLPLKRKDS